jgi:lipopolysaccharide export system permease protein
MKKFLPPTLSFYLIRNYFLNFLILLLALLGIIYLFDTVELLRRAAKMDNIPLSLTLTMGLYKLPEVGQLIFPFAILFSAMLSFWQLNRRHELVIVRSSGLSVWQFILPMILVAMMIGMFKVAVINPLGALFISKYEQMESQYLERKSNLIVLSEQGLWLRQENETGNAILHAERIKMPEWALNKVMVFFFAPDRTFLKRIDAGSAVLEEGAWTFRDAYINAPRQVTDQADFLTLSTDLTKDDLQNSFAAKETISFWKLPSYIKILENTGFDSTALKIHFQNLLAQPLLYIAMVLLAASVSLRPPRLRGTSVLIVSGVIIGFVVFFASSFMQALGASQQIPVMVAAWFPALICFILGIGALMVLEDG